MDAQLKESNERMEKAIEAFQRELSRLRTGRANLGILDDVHVDYYGQQMPLNQVATLGVPESRLITVQPWEANLIGEIEKAIEKANLGLTPQNDGKIIRLPIPPLTEERRKELVKGIKHHAEEAKVAIRHARREANEKFKKQEKAGEINEDDLKRLEKETQKLTDDHTDRIDSTVEKKEEEIMKV